MGNTFVENSGIFPNLIALVAFSKSIRTKSIKVHFIQSNFFRNCMVTFVADPEWTGKPELLFLSNLNMLFLHSLWISRLLTVGYQVF